MKYVEQSHKDLRLYLADKHPDTSAFTMISQSNFSEGFFQVHFGVLAESHFVAVEYMGDTFTEVCACEDLDVHGIEPTFLTNIGDAKKTMQTDRFSYSFTYRVTNFAIGEVRLSVLQSKRPHPYSRYLEHVFPASKPGEKTAVTEIYVTVGDSVFIESVHTYPNTDAMVFTASELTIKKSP